MHNLFSWFDNKASKLILKLHQLVCIVCLLLVQKHRILINIIILQIFLLLILIGNFTKSRCINMVKKTSPIGENL